MEGGVKQQQWALDATYTKVNVTRETVMLSQLVGC